MRKQAIRFQWISVLTVLMFLFTVGCSDSPNSGSNSSTKEKITFTSVVNGSSYTYNLYDGSYTVTKSSGTATVTKTVSQRFRSAQPRSTAIVETGTYVVTKNGYTFTPQNGKSYTASVDGVKIMINDEDFVHEDAPFTGDVTKEEVVVNTAILGKWKMTREVTLLKKVGGTEEKEEYTYGADDLYVMEFLATGKAVAYEFEKENGIWIGEVDTFSYQIEGNKIKLFDDEFTYTISGKTLTVSWNGTDDTYEYIKSVTTLERFTGTLPKITDTDTPDDTLTETPDDTLTDFGMTKGMATLYNAYGKGASALDLTTGSPISGAVSSMGEINYNRADSLLIDIKTVNSSGRANSYLTGELKSLNGTVFTSITAEEFETAAKSIKTFIATMVAKADAISPTKTSLMVSSDSPYFVAKLAKNRGYAVITVESFDAEDISTSSMNAGKMELEYYYISTK